MCEKYSIVTSEAACKQGQFIRLFFNSTESHDQESRFSWNLNPHLRYQQAKTSSSQLKNVGFLHRSYLDRTTKMLCYTQLSARQKQTNGDTSSHSSPHTIYLSSWIIMNPLQIVTPIYLFGSSQVGPHIYS